MLTGELYKALKETCKKGFSIMQYGSKAYAKVAHETLPPRELEATLLLKAAAKLQAVHDTWRERPSGLHDALLYNRRLWTIFLDAVTEDNNKLPVGVRSNIANLGIYVMGETFSLMTNPQPRHLTSLININRGIAAGLRGKA